MIKDGFHGGNNSYGLSNPAMSSSVKQISQSIAHVPTSTVNETVGSNFSLANKQPPQTGSRSDLNNVMKSMPPGMIRTPQVPKQNQQNSQDQGYLSNMPSNNNNSVQQPPPAPIYHPQQTNTSAPSHQKPFDITKTVNSIVDNWEADLAKHVKRRPSGQFESCKQKKKHFFKIEKSTIKFSTINIKA